MTSLTQKEDMTKIRQLSNVYLFIYLRDYQQRNNQFWRGIIIYAWYFIQMTGLFVMCSNHVITENEKNFTTTGGSSSNMIFKLWMQITIYSRFNIIIKFFSDRFGVPVFYFIILFLIDALFIYFYAFLAKKSTKIQENNFKKYQNKIMFVSIYIDLFRWFYLSMKSEIIISRFLCSQNSDSSSQFISPNQNLCSYLPSFKDLNSAENTTLDVLCSLNIVSLLICLILVFIVNHSCEFNQSNPFKSQYSEIKVIEYFLIIICQYLAFLQNNSYAYLFITLKIVYYLYEYFTYFPLYRADISCHYLKILSIYIYCSILMILREFTQLIDESFHLEILFIGSSLIFGFISVLQNQIKIHIISIKLSEEPVTFPSIVVQHFYELLSLYQKMTQSNLQAKLQLHGILTTHQSTCVDELCPCLFNQEQLEREMGYDVDQLENLEVKKRKKKSQKVLDQENAMKIAEKKQEDDCKGVYFTELMNNEIQFSKWIYEFVNYHFRYLIFKSKKERNYNSEVISMKFWFFLINDRHNIINGLYNIKAQLQLLTSRSYFISMIDLAVTRLVENNIKQKDRSLKYSYRKKDMEEAIQFEIFEQFVLSEVIKDRFKKDLIVLLDQKVLLMQSMIEGYEELETMQNQMISLISQSAKLENLVKSELRHSQSNLHYLKMLSILRIKVQNDPIFASKIEKKIEEVHAKSSVQDVNLIHSLTVLNGNVISIIASFKNEKGKILKYSERTPQFFGYKKTAFDSSVKSVVQLMPNIISVNHDQIIERLIIEGTPKIMRTYRVAVAKDKEGFLFPVKIYINYYFQVIDDFIFSALILKLTTQSSYILLNSSFQIEGITKTFLEFLNQLDDDMTKEHMDKIPLQLFLPDLVELVDSSHQTNSKMEGVKLPMIIPDFCSKYFIGYKQYLKKMQGKNLSEKQLVDSFMSQSKKYFKEDVYIFELTMNIVQDTFKLLNGFEFTVFQIEVQNILPLQIISNGFRTTHKSGTDQDSFLPNNSNRQNAHDNIKLKNQMFEFDKSQTFKLTQDQIKNKFNFKSTQSQVPSSQTEFQSDFKSASLSSRNNLVLQSPASPQRQVGQYYKQTSLSAVDHIQNDLVMVKKQNIQDITQNSKINDESNFLNSINNTEISLIKNKVTQLRNDLLMEMTEEELNKLRKSYDDIDIVAAQGIEKNLPNGDFPIRMDLEINQQLCEEDNQLNKKQTNNDSLSTLNSPIKNAKGMMDFLSRQGTAEGSSRYSYQTSKSQIEMQAGNQQQVKRSQSLNRQQSHLSQKPDKDDDLKRRAKQRMSIIQENMNDSEIDLNMTTQGLFENKLNETQQNLLTKQNINDHFKTEVASFSVINNTMVADSTPQKYEQNDTINIYRQITHQNESEQDEKPLYSKQSDQQYSEEDQQEQFAFNKNKSLASNFFNEQQILTRNSTVDRDSNPVLANLQMLRESTKYSKHRISVQQEFSDGGTIDDLDKNAESVRNQSTEKEEVKLRPEHDEQRAASVASSQNSQVNTSIQRIYYSASSKKMPFFMSLFFQIIGFQLIFFGTICAIVCLVFSDNYQGLKNLTAQLNFSSKILVPYSQNTLALNAFTMKNENMITFSDLYLNLSNEIQKSMVEQMQIDVYDIINQHVKYNYQSDYLSEIIQIFVQSDATLFQSQIFFFESIKTILENFYYLLVSPQGDIKLGIDQLYNIKVNYYQIEDLIQTKVITGISDQMSVIHKNIEELNLNIIIISTVLLFLCFILLFYPFWRYSEYAKGVLLGVSRMTEKEAEGEIIFCRFLASLLKSSDEKYLAIKYTSFDLSQIQNDEFGISSHYNSQFRKNQQKTHLKKNYMLSQRISQPRIRLFQFATYFTALFIFSIAIFSTAFSIIQDFSKQLNPAISIYQDFLYAFQKYSSFVYSTDQIFTQRLIRINKRTDGQLSDDFISKLNLRREKDLNDFRSFFESDFLVLTQKSIYSDSLNSYINSIQKTNLCEYQQDKFTSSQLQTCEKTMNSIMEQGLKVVISRISDDVGMKQINSWSDQLVLDHIQVKEYENQLQVIQLTFFILLQVSQHILDDIQQLIDDYINQIIFIYSIGAVLYSVAFLIVCFQIYKNIFRRFFLIKKTVHLMPYNRLQDDQTTMNLIKNALEG